LETASKRYGGTGDEECGLSHEGTLTHCYLWLKQKSPHTAPEDQNRFQVMFVQRD